MKNIRTFTPENTSPKERRLLKFAGGETPREEPEIKMDPKKPDSVLAAIGQEGVTKIDLRLLSERSELNIVTSKTEQKYAPYLQGARDRGDTKKEAELNLKKEAEIKAANTYRAQMINLVQLFNKNGFSEQHIAALNMKLSEMAKNNPPLSLELTQLQGMAYTLPNKINQKTLYTNLLTVDPQYYIETGNFFVKEIDPQTGGATSEWQFATPEVMVKVREQQEQNATRKAELEGAKRIKDAEELERRNATLIEQAKWPREFHKFIKLDEQNKRIPISDTTEAEALIAMRGANLDKFYELVDPAILDNGKVMSQVLGKVPKENLATFLAGRSDKLKKDQKFMESMLSVIKSNNMPELIKPFMQALAVEGNALRANEALMTQVADFAFETGKSESLREVVAPMLGLRNNESFMKHIATKDMGLAMDLASRELKAQPPSSPDSFSLVILAKNPSMIDRFEKAVKEHPLVIRAVQLNIEERMKKLSGTEQAAEEKELRAIMAKLPDFTYLIKNEDLVDKSEADLTALRDATGKLAVTSEEKENSLKKEGDPMKMVPKWAEARMRFYEISHLAQRWLNYKKEYKAYKESYNVFASKPLDPMEQDAITDAENAKIREVELAKEKEAEIARQKQEAARNRGPSLIEALGGGSNK